MSNIPDGFVLVPGRGRELALAVLAAAETAKVEPGLVRTTADGYLVPDKVAKAYEASLKKPAAKKADEPAEESTDTEPTDVVDEKPPAKKPAPKKKS
jgi:hypothetical protein